MSDRLDNKPQIRTLASDLGLPNSISPCQAILGHVRARIRRISKKFNCKSLNGLLEAVANEVETVFREVHSDKDLVRISEEYVAKGEQIFANLAEELRQPDDFAITIRRHHREAWEPQFVSVIDCRGDKAFKIYFSKWHELAHLLTLTPQMRLVFRRSHSHASSHDPEERMMDIIASEVGFLPDFLSVAPPSEISFEAIRQIKREFCPDASLQSATIGIVKALPSPCILVEAKLANRKHEGGGGSQPGLDFGERMAAPALRAVHATVNIAAREDGVQFHRNWRVPGNSVIARVFVEGGYGEADEDLSWWSTSNGSRLAPSPVRVKAKKAGDSVQALLILLAA